MKLTLDQVNNLDGYKPRCRACHGPCHPRSYEYRSLQLCPYCYDTWPPPHVRKKEDV